MKFFSPRTRSSKTQDMTEGNPFKLIFLFSIPVLLGNLFQNFYSMADSIIVGRLLGTNALAAVGNTGPMNFLILGFISGLTSGFAVITAQAFGSKNKEELKTEMDALKENQEAALNIYNEFKEKYIEIIGYKTKLAKNKVYYKAQDKIDAFLTSRWAGIPIFAVVMFLVFHIYFLM